MNHMKKCISSQNSMYQSILKLYYICFFQTFKWKNIVFSPKNVYVSIFRPLSAYVFCDFAITFLEFNTLYISRLPLIVLKIIFILKAKIGVWISVGVSLMVTVEDRSDFMAFTNDA